MIRKSESKMTERSRQYKFEVFSERSRQYKFEVFSETNHEN